MRLGILALEPFGLAQVGDQLVVGGLADRAGVEQDQIGLSTLAGLLVAERLEHPAQVLGIVLIHLAAEGRYVESLRHWGQR
jgi:hypothetical protein